MGPSVIIDDSNSAIQYHGGSWLQGSAPNITDIGLAGSPMFETLHMLPTANGTLTYSFNGTGISAFVSNFAFSGNYTAECLVDGGSGQISANLTIQRGNNIELCTFGGLDVNKTHNFTLDVTFPAGQHQNETGPTGFLFDYFLISPPPSMSLEKSDVLYTTYDSFIRSALLGNTWMGTDVTGGGYAAGLSVAQFNISFTGVAAWWRGFRAGRTMPAQKSVHGTTYSVDETTSVSFSTLPYDAAFGFTIGIYQGGLEVPPEMTNQLLFHTPEFPYGKHTLKVFSPGSTDSGVNQLTLQSLVIQGTSSNSSLPVQTTITPSPQIIPTFITITSDNGPRPGTQIDVGKVVGGVVGGVFAVVVVAAWFIIARRKRARQDKAVDPVNIDYLPPEPFRIDADQHTVTVGPRKVRDSQQDIVDPFMQELEAPPLSKWTRHLARQSGGQPSPSAEELEDQLPQQGSEIDEHPRPHRQATLVDIDSLSDSSLPEPPHAHDMNGDTADDPVEVSPLHEEDSGMRLAQHGSRETFVLVLPPMYTAH